MGQPIPFIRKLKKDTDTFVVRIWLLSQWYINRQSVNTRTILYSWNIIFNKGTFQMSEVVTLRYICSMKRKLTQWWSTIPPISTKWTTTSHFKLLNTKMIMTYDIGNPVPGLGQTQKCGRVKPINGIPTLPLLIIESPMTI